MFENCSQGRFSSEWQKKLGPNVKTYAWQNPVQNKEVGMFNRGEGAYEHSINLSTFIMEAVIRKWSHLPIDYLFRKSEAVEYEQK